MDKFIERLLPGSWSDTERALWAAAVNQSMAPGVMTEESGTSPLSLTDAVGGKLKSLVQHGKCEVSGADITCNNGTLGVGPVTSNLLGGEALADYICSKIPTAVKDTQAKTVLIPKGKYCGFPSSVLHYEAETAYTFIDKYDNSGGYYGGANYSCPGGGYDYEEVNPEPGTIPPLMSVTWPASINMGVPVVTERHVCTPGSGNIISYISVDAPSNKPVLLYYENCGFFKGEVQIADFEPYVEGVVASGTPEVITLTDANSDTQTASAANLFAVGNVYDEQDIVKGKIIRRTEAVVSDGTTPTESYIGTPAAGNILVKVRSEPVTERVTAQPLTASAGANTITVTAEVDDIDLVAKYKAEE